MARKSWIQKRDDAPGLPKVERILPKMRQSWGTGTVVIASPREVDAIMKKIPAGKLITTSEIRQKLAKKHGATIACPITTGIFALISAHAAEEEAAAGASATTPYWRTLKPGGELNPKFPGGIAGLKRKLRSEGHRVIARGKRWLVADYALSLATLR